MSKHAGRSIQSEGQRTHAGWPWARPSALKPLSSDFPVPAQPLLFRGSFWRGWVWHGPGIVRMCFHREGKKNHMAVRSLCYRTLLRSGATVGHPGAFSWWGGIHGLALGRDAEYGLGLVWSHHGGAQTLPLSVLPWA